MNWNSTTKTIIITIIIIIITNNNNNSNTHQRAGLNASYVADAQKKVHLWMIFEADE